MRLFACGVSLALLAAFFAFQNPATAVEIATLPVGNAGNLASSGGFGAVDYDYRIGKFEVTNIEYVEFLNNADSTAANSLALYGLQMTNDVNGGILQNLGAAEGSRYSAKSGYEQKPAAWVSWYDTLRFANWMHNGQGASDTETGAYTLQGGTPIPINATTITRNPGALWALASEDEWGKAAYHKNDGATGNYFTFPNSSDTRSDSDRPTDSDVPDPTRAANVYRTDFIANNYNDGFAVTGSTSFPSVAGLTDAGSYDSTTTPYGAFDMSGNTHEWTETIVALNGSQPNPRFRGASFWSGSFGAADSIDSITFSSNFAFITGSFAERDFGFRVVQLVPEPTSAALMLMSVAFAGSRRSVRRQLAA